MGAYAIRRGLLIIPTLLLLTILVFLLVRLMPGNIVDVMVQDLIQMNTTSGGASSTTASGIDINRAEIERRLGLDVPIFTQYARWLGVARTPNPETGKLEYDGILQGNLGKSLRSDRSMSQEILNRVPITFELNFLAMLIGLIAIPIGIYSAIRQDSWLDWTARSVSILAMAAPAFWLATMLIAYASRWHIWSPPEYVRFSHNPIANLKIMIVPAVIMAIGSIGGSVRVLRTITLEVLRQDYVRTAWAKGLGERVIVLRHAFKNALIPFVNDVAGTIGMIFSGSVIMENIFNLPGMGRYTYNMIIQRDYWVVSGINLIFGIMTLVMILLTDLAYAVVDPRVHY